MERWVPGLVVRTRGQLGLGRMEVRLWPRVGLCCGHQDTWKRGLCSGRLSGTVLFCGRWVQDALKHASPAYFLGTVASRMKALLPRTHRWERAQKT